MLAAPVKKGFLVRLSLEILGRPIGEMRLARPFHWVVARVDPRLRGNRAEFPDSRVNDVSVIHDIGVVVKLALDERRAFADFRVAAEPAGADIGACMD